MRERQVVLQVRGGQLRSPQPPLRNLGSVGEPIVLELGEKIHAEINGRLTDSE